MSQEIINVGASANDGQGDPIRTAFEKTNNNFTQLFGIGASQIIYNGTSNVNIPFLNGNVFISVGGVGNVMVLDPTGANISGKLAVTGNVTGGNLLTGGAISSAGTITGVTVVGDYIQGIITTASQTQITALGTLGSLSVSANIQAGNVRSSGTVSAVGGILAGANVFGTNLKASGLMSVTGSATAGNIFTGGSLSATSNIKGGNLLTSGLISATGNINAGNIIANNIGNIAALNLDGNASTILYGNGVFAAAAPSSSYGDSNVTTLLSNLGSNTISTTANVTGGNIIANNIGNIAALNLDGNASTILYGNGVFAPAAASSYGDSNVTSLLSNLGSNTISTTANVTGNYFIGNGSQLTNLPAPSVTVDNTSIGYMDVMLYDGNIKYTANVTVEPASGNIITLGNVSVGNIIADNIGNVAALNLDGNASTVLYGNGTFAPAAGGGSYGDSNVTTLLSNLGSNTISTTANVTGGNILTSGLISVTGNVQGGNIRSAGTISAVGGVLAGANVVGINLKTTGFSSATGNIIGGNILTGGLISAVGNITANNIGNIAALNLDGNASTVLYGNGVFAAAASSSYGDSNVTTLLSNLGSNTISTTANVTGNYFLGNGSQLTGITAAANTGNVTFDNQAVVGTGDQIGAGGLYLAPGNTSVGNLQYLRVRGGDVATHIHFDTGNNAYFDQYFGDDGKYVKLEAAGNVLIGSNDAVGNAAQWTFDTTGNLTVPGGGAVFSIGTGTMGVTANATSGNAYLGLDDTSSAVTLYGNAGVQIGTNGNVGWNFQPSGNLTLPDGGLLGTTYGYTALQAGNAGGLLIQNANCYVGVSPDESFTVIAANQPWVFSNANAAATLQCPVVAFSVLPAATYAAGLRAFVNDSNASSFGQVVGGSGAYTVPVWSDGANWRVG